MRTLVFIRVLAFVVALSLALPVSAQQSPLGPTATAEEVRTYEAFRSWITQQPVEVLNAFLVAVTKGLKPGRSLDVGMGQGRNTIYLAQQGWDSVGFDPADRAIAAAQAQAKTLGVKITTHVDAPGDFGGGEATRVVRLAAVKP